MTQSETTIASLFDGGASLLTSNIAILIFSLLTILIVYSVLFKDFSLLTTFASGLAGIALLGGVISVLVVLVLASDQKEQEWRDWATEHCKVIEKREGATTTGVGVSLKGQAGVFIGGEPDQTGYLCDDGITYWKNE
ncbi:TPA: hypothetical protein ACMEXA_004815 [Klebsiella variicola subsp. variicola]|uniref:hypothetical protein n=1 Tax=Klebsiella pneumoniae complex TaxID=3390273 RepID=UPI000C1A3524|nr:MULTISPECIES: hypothetical protein [Klebsiella]HBQ8858122.1 hypothetical protein [Klebsiella variicola subsp. variicola]ATR02114.1 hypothetical protein CTI55_26045 [Klebsiella pneumoniae]ATR07509.1 hypothetical protein CTI56_27425 [Klebsiella pneumoniae]ATR18618.1 hypothetical protein CTI58_27325 [Klebsiella pneumoniae]MEC5999017.1 hypothetical protein [Klebsiella variicola]